MNLDEEKRASRRRMLLALASAGALGTCRLAFSNSGVRFTRDPFQLGIASGEPAADGFVLWTRLAPDPLQGGGMDPLPVPVRWEVADDEGFRHIAARGEALAVPEFAHSVHVEVGGLRPARWYWYRFRAAGAESGVGRTRTLPALTEKVVPIRLAAAACQHWMYGTYVAHRHLAEEEIDFLIHNGDYIYEAPSKKKFDHLIVRKVPFGIPETLADYRRVHAFYRSDPNLQRCHASFPWVVMWDDHDVENDYTAREGPKHSGSAFLSLRAAAYRAYWEHMPLRAAQRPHGPDALMYRHFDFGRAARFSLVDARQYRSALACSGTIHKGHVVDSAQCSELMDASRTMLGAEQEGWLLEGMRESHPRWNFLVQGLMMAPFDQRKGPAIGAWTDGWDGYPASRTRILEHIHALNRRNTVVIGGDRHAFIASDIPLDPRAARPIPVASEFLCGTISSRLSNHEAYAALLPENPHIRFMDARHHGYTRFTVGAARVEATVRAVADVRDETSSIRTIASYVVEHGAPGMQRSS